MCSGNHLPAAQLNKPLSLQKSLKLLILQSFGTLTEPTKSSSLFRPNNTGLKYWLDRLPATNPVEDANKVGGAVAIITFSLSVLFFVGCHIKEKVNKLTQEKESNTEDTVSNEPVESFIEREKSSLLKDKIINPINDVVSSTVDSIKNTTSEALDSIESDFKTNIKSAIDSVANFNTFEQFNSAKESIINTAKTLKASILSKMVIQQLHWIILLVQLLLL